MVLVAEMLADLTLLKMINSTDAVSLVSTSEEPLQSPTKAAHDSDPDFSRAVEFLALNSAQQPHQRGDVQNERVDKLLRRLTGQPDRDDEDAHSSASSSMTNSRSALGGGVRMAGSWADR